MNKQDLKSKIEKLEKGIASKVTPENLKASLKSQKEKFEKELADLEKKEKSELSKKIKDLKASVKTKSTKSTTKSSLSRDGARKAKKSGKKISEDGNVYYEKRANRTDSQTSKKPYLEKGGMITKDDIVSGAKFKSNDGNVFIIDEVNGIDKNGYQAVRSSNEGGRKGDYRDDINDLVMFLNEEQSEKMAKGGETEPFSKTGKGEFVSTEDRLNSCSQELFNKNYADCSKEQRDEAFDLFLKKYAISYSSRKKMADGGKLDKDISYKIDQDLKFIVTKKEKYKKELKELKDAKSQDKDSITYLEYEMESLDKLYDRLSRIKNQKMAKGGELNKRKIYSVKQLKELGFKQIKGDKKYRYYFEKDGKVNEFRVIPSIGIYAGVVKEEDTMLAQLSNGGKLAKGGDLYDDMDEDIEFANKKAKMIANSLKGMGYNIVEFTEADYDTDANISLSETVNVNVHLEGELAIVTDEGDGTFLFMDCGKSYATLLEKLKNLENFGLVKRNTMDKMENGGKAPRTIKLTLSDKDSYYYTYKQDGTTGTAGQITFGFGKEPFQYEVKKISKSLEPLKQDILDAFTIQGIKQHEYKGGFSEAIKHLDTKVVYEDNFAKGGSTSSFSRLFENNDIEKRVLFVINYYADEVDYAKKSGNYSGFTRERIIKNYKKDLKAAQKGEEFDNFLFESAYQSKMNGKSFEEGGYMDKGAEVNTFNYRMLDRLRSDNDYYLGNGNRYEKHLWAGNVDGQIAEMKKLWNQLPENKKPEWLSMEDIENYEKEMKSDNMADGGYMADGGNINKTEKIKDYYINEFPTDDLGNDINTQVTFDGLYTVLNNKFNVYDYIGVNDSLVRERVFQKLSEIKGVKYDEIYSKWLESDKLEVFGYETQNFDMCPLAVEEFEKAIEQLSKTDSDAKKTALSRAAMYVDDVLGVEKKAKEDNIVSKNEFQYAVTQSLVASAYNYASGLEVNLTKFLPMHIFEIATKLVHTDQEARKDELTSYDMFVVKGMTGDAVFNNMTQDERRNLAMELKNKKSFEDGGSIEESNYRMVVSQAKAIKHHADELLNVLTPDIEVEAWVVGKIERASTDLSDITHYIDGLSGENEEMEVVSDTYFAEGGQLEKGVYYLGKPKKEGSVWAQKIVELDETGLSFATDYGRKLKDFPSKDYKKISEEELSEFIKNSPKHQNVSSDTAKFEHYAAGGMIVGRYYKDNQGEEYRYIGEDRDGQPLFSDGQKVAPKSLDDFEPNTKETKLFRFFENGGMMAQGGGLNLGIRKIAQEEGFTPKELGKEYELTMAQAVVEALTDANYHDAARKLVSLLEKNPKIAIKPNYPDPSDPKFNEKFEAINKEYDSKYWEADDKTRNFAIKVSQKSGWDGYAIAGAFEYLVRVDGGYHKLADNIEKAMEDEDKMAKGGGVYKNYGKHNIEDYLYLKDGTKVYVEEGYYRYPNPDGVSVAGIYYDVKYPNGEEKLISIDDIVFPIRERMAEGGMTEHGLKIGDKVTSDMFWDNQIVVENQKTHKKAQINLETGQRKDEMADGGVTKPRLDCVCTKTIKFTNGLNYFEKFTYGCRETHSGDGVSVSYEDGRFTTMSKEIFNKHFEYVNKMAMGGEIPDVIKSLISDMQDRNVARKTIKVKKGSDGHLKFMKDVQPAIDKKILIVRHNPIDDNEMFISLTPNHLHKMVMGGKVKFEDKVKAIKASLLKTKKVSPKVQKDYGKTYSPKEAEQSAKRIVGSRLKKGMK
jgi:hypothetical protein